MSTSGHGSSTQKRFSGDGNSVAAEYKMRETKSSCSLSCPENWWNAPRDSKVLDMRSSGWSGRSGTGIEAAEEGLRTEIHEKRDDGRFHWTTETCVLPAFSKNVSNFLSEARGTLFCVDVDLRVWENQRSCLQP